MWGLIADVWTELIVVVVGAVLGWFAKHFQTQRRNNNDGKGKP